MILYLKMITWVLFAIRFSWTSRVAIFSIKSSRQISYKERQTKKLLFSSSFNGFVHVVASGLDVGDLVRKVLNDDEVL